MAFIEFTTVDSHNSVLINVDQIQAISPGIRDSSNETDIYVATNKFTINESYLRVKSRIADITRNIKV